jgi:DNA-directed RNA polymerase subunit K/omega
MESSKVISEDHTNFYTNYDTSKNITNPVMSKYEYTLCLGIRAEQLARGSEPLIKLTDDLDSPVLIAKEEIKQRKCPLIIEKSYGNKKEYWKLEDLTILDVVD